MHLFNPGRSRTCRSAPYRATIFPFETEEVPNQIKNGPKQRISQYRSFLSESELAISVPGPMVRDQPVRNRTLPVRSDNQLTFDNIGYPGLVDPTPSTLNGLTFQGKHFSNSIFYNQERPLSHGKGAAPYWRFAQWAYQWPEYFILDASSFGSGYSTIVAGIPDDPDPANQVVHLVPVLTSGLGGRFLMRRSEGYLFLVDGSPVTNFGSRTGQDYFGLADPDCALCATWVPVYNIDQGTFPSPMTTWSLSFRPYMLSGYSQVNADAAQIGPMSWTLSCIDYNNLQTTSFIEFDPFPTTGTASFKYSYGATDFVSGTVTIPNTGIPATDIVTLQSSLQAIFASSAYSFSDVEIAYEGSLWLFKLHIVGPKYGQLFLTNNSTDVNIKVYEDVQFGINAASGDAYYFTPAAGFRTLNQYIRLDPDPDFPGNFIRVVVTDPEVTCKDTRDVGAFDSSFEFLQSFGQDRTQQGLSYGSMSAVKKTEYRLRTLMTNSDLNTDTQFYGFPGRPNPVIKFFNGNGNIQINPIQVSLTPVIL